MDATQTGGVASPTIWQFLDMPDSELERADLVAMNITVARGIPSLQHLGPARYINKVDQWTLKFRRELLAMEQGFHAAPHKWKNDIRFFRILSLQGFLVHKIGIRYNHGQVAAESIFYKNPSDLFINGIVDTRQGTCGNMSLLHVAMCRRMGWPVALACAKGHFISRFDDGQVVHNIEASSAPGGMIASDPDSHYIEKFNLPRRAVDCGSDLRCLTAREMLGTFLALRARHFGDVGKWEEADVDSCLSRVLFPKYRRAFIWAVVRTMRRGEQLFEPDEVGHPNQLFPLLFPEKVVPRGMTATPLADWLHVPALIDPAWALPPSH